MPSTIALLEIVLPVFFVIGAGYVIRGSGILTKQADESMLSLLVKIFIPCLALDVIIGNEALRKPANLLLPPLLGFLSIALAIGISLIMARLFLKDAVVRRTFACAVGVQNYGYIPLPICAALFSREVTGVLFAFNLGVEMAMWSLAVATISGHGAGRDWWRRLISPPIIAVVAGIALNLAGAGSWTPASVHTALHMLGVCAVPLALVLTGASLADYATPRILATEWKTTSLAIALRLGVLPLTLVGLAMLIPADSALRSVLLVQAAMPAAVFPIVLTKIHHGDMPTALRVVFGTSLVSLITIPLWLAFGLRILQAE